MKLILKQFTGVFSTLIILGAVILLVNVFMLISNPKIYGNTKEEIMKVIYQLGEMDKAQEEIEVLEVIDMGTTRVAGFCTSLGKTGIVEFEKDKKGKYVYTYGETQQEQIGKYVQWFNNVYPEKAPKPEDHIKDGVAEDKSSQIVFIVIGNGNEEYDVNLKVNETYDFNGEIPSGKSRMLSFKMPEIPGAESYSFDLKVIDSQGNNILENN